jgi:hypothetical protein
MFMRSTIVKVAIEDCDGWDTCLECTDWILAGSLLVWNLNKLDV